jgi:hypothetical protein
MSTFTTFADDVAFLSKYGAVSAPGAALTHVHQTYHFTGPRDALDAIAKKVLGVGLVDVGVTN